MKWFTPLDENYSHAEVQSTYRFRHQKNSRIVVYIQPAKTNKGKISIPQILGMQNLSPDSHSYCSRQVISLILRLRWLSFVWTLLHGIFPLIQTKYLQTGKKSICKELEMFADSSVLKSCFPSHMKIIIQDHLSLNQHTVLYSTATVLNCTEYYCSVPSMHHFSEYFNSSVSVS